MTSGEVAPRQAIRGGAMRMLVAGPSLSGGALPPGYLVAARMTDSVLADPAIHWYRLARETRPLPWL